jgi:hypothetical protein
MAKKIQEPKLTVELIPKTCHYSNVRTTVKKKEWDKIRLIVYEKAGHKCEICHQTGLEQGYRHKIECHEIWKYNDTKKIQKLVGLIALCPLCHQVKHIGRASFIGKEKMAFNRLSNINKWDLEQVTQYVAEAYEKNKERSNFDWTLDISLLKKSPYNIVIGLTETRKYEKVKYKKRKYTKKKTAKRKRPKKKN